MVESPLNVLVEIDNIWEKPAPVRKGPLRVTYLIPHHQLTGGMKMLMEQIRYLRRRGHYVRAVSKGLPAVLPPWTDVAVDSEYCLGANDRLDSACADSDVVVAGFIHQLPEAATLTLPTFYWEQGHEYLFDDRSVPQSSKFHALFAHSMRLPHLLAGVSPIVQQILKRRFNRTAGLVVNGIDTERFRPGERPKRNRVLLVGNPRLRFKGFPEALQALSLVHQRLGHLEVTWVSQVPVQVEAPFPVKVLVNPPQDRLPEIYREADVFVSASFYEAFGLPPLEAMASGVPVVATDSGGIRTYARPGENCLLADPGDVESLAWGILQVLLNPDIADFLSAEGRRTAEAFTWDRAIDQLEDALYRAAYYMPLIRS